MDSRYQKISEKLKGRKITWAGKISDSMKGNQNSKGAKRSKQWIDNLKKRNTERIVSEETKRKLSLINKGQWLKEKNPNWKGGYTEEKRLRDEIEATLEYKLWRTAVFKRDNWTCQTCGKRGIKLNAHHIKRVIDIIKEYKLKTLEDAINCQELWDINNGVTLSVDCHKLAHKKICMKNKINSLYRLLLSAYGVSMFSE